jgi:hypothetical protein
MMKVASRDGPAASGKPLDQAQMTHNISIPSRPRNNNEFGEITCQLKEQINIG